MSAYRFSYVLLNKMDCAAGHRWRITSLCIHRWPHKPSVASIAATVAPSFDILWYPTANWDGQQQFGNCTLDCNEIWNKSVHNLLPTEARN